MTKELNNEEIDPVIVVLVLSAAVMVAAVIGALIGFSLSFTALSPLVIVGFASITALHTRFFLCSEIIKGEEFVVAVIAGASLTIAAAGGVALGAVAHSLFPGAMFSACGQLF